MHRFFLGPISLSGYDDPSAVLQPRANTGKHASPNNKVAAAAANPHYRRNEHKAQSKI
jgi:hypothetical protein